MAHFISLNLRIILQLIDRLRATRWTPPDYWQADNSNGLVMVICNYHWLNSACRVLISTLSYNTRLAKVKVDPNAKNQGQRSNGSNRKAPRQTDTRTRNLGYETYIAPAMRSIINNFESFFTEKNVVHRPIQCYHTVNGSTTLCQPSTHNLKHSTVITLLYNAL